MAKAGTGSAKLLDDLVHGLLQVGCDFVKTLHDKSLVDGIEACQELRWMVSLDLPRFQRLRREVFQIECDDNLALAPNRGGKNMPVFGIVGQAGFNRLETLHHRFGE